MASTSPTQLSAPFKTAAKVIEIDGRPVAFVLRDNEWPRGLSFITPDETFIQVGSWRYNAGKVLDAHVHKEYRRVATKTQEAVFVKQGKMKVTLYSQARAVAEEIVLRAGDLLVITEAGHGYEILENDTQILEVKNGPFVGVDVDKEKF